MIRNGVISSVLLVSVALGIELNTINVQSSKVYETEVEALQSVHIIDEKEMQTFSIDDITDMSALLPNINISGIGNRMDRTFTFRGVSNYTTLESSIALYVDDVPIPFSYGLGSVDMENVSHIEVVKGPQGTLFGKGAESGVINIYTKQPTDTFGNSVKLGVGEYNTKEFYMRSSGPINDQTKFSLAVTKNLTDGYSKNVFMDSHFDHKDRLGVSAKVHHTIDDSSTIAFNYTYSKLDDGGSPLKLDTKENPHKIENQKSNDYAKIDHNLFSLIYKKTYDNMELTSTTTFAKEVMDRHIYINILGGFTMDFDVDIQEFTQEFRVKQRFDNVEWIHGLFYSDKTRFNYKENQTLTTSGLTSLNDLTNPDKNYALFTKFKYIYSDQIIYTAGIRYQKTNRDFSRNLNNFGQPSQQAGAKTTWSHVLPTLSVSYFTEDNAHLYLTYAKGYRPGGYNYREGTTSLTPYQPEVVDSVEFGYKKLYNDTLDLNVATFYNAMTDLRIIEFNDNLGTKTANVNKAYSYGAEVTLNMNSDDLNLFASLGVTKAKFDDFQANRTYEGNKIIDVPDLTAALGGKYRFDHHYYLQADIQHMGKRYYDMANNAKASSFSLTNLGIGYKTKSFEGLLYANNLFDKRYVDFMIKTPNHHYYHFGSQRVIGLKITKHF